MRIRKTVTTKANVKLPSQSVHAVMTAYRAMATARRFEVMAQLRAENQDLALLFDLEDIRHDRLQVAHSVP